jgi:hypothetical protein
VLASVFKKSLRKGDYSDETVYQIWRTYIVSKPKQWYCWLRLGLDAIFLFLLPLFYMYAAGTSRTATVFMILGFFSFLRIYIDAA